MDYSVIELPFAINEDGSTNPLFKVVDAEGNDVFFCTTAEEAGNYINNNKT